MLTWLYSPHNLPVFRVLRMNNNSVCVCGYDTLNMFKVVIFSIYWEGPYNINHATKVEEVFFLLQKITIFRQKAYSYFSCLFINIVTLMIYCCYCVKCFAKREDRNLKINCCNKTFLWSIIKIKLKIKSLILETKCSIKLSCISKTNIIGNMKQTKN